MISMISNVNGVGIREITIKSSLACEYKLPGEKAYYRI